MPITWPELQQRIVTDTVEVSLAKRYDAAGTYAVASVPDLVRALQALGPATRAAVLAELAGTPEERAVPPNTYWMEMGDGRRFDVGCPDPNAIRFETIALGLERTNRYAGQTAEPVSVLLHQLVAAQEATRNGDVLLQEYVLHHDDAEAIVSDLTHPVKSLLRHLSKGRSVYDLVESRVQAAIWQALGLPAPSPEQSKRIKRCDLLARAAERVAFLPNTGQHEWESLAGLDVPEGLDSLAKHLHGLGPAHLRDQWLAKARDLASARGIWLR